MIEDALRNLLNTAGIPIVIAAWAIPLGIAAVAGLIIFVVQVKGKLAGG